MISTLRTRIVFGAAISIALASVLSGCTALGSVFPHTTSASAKPAVGDCWVSSFDTAERAAAWTAGGAVGCASKHQLSTYAVVTVTSSAATWRTRDDNLDSKVATDASRACDKKYFAAFADAPEGGRLTRFFFVAPESQWKRGARWVRCDIGVLRTGSLSASPSFASLPTDIATIEKQVESTPDLFATCVTTTDPSGQTGPLDDPKAVVADCTQDYQWRFESTFIIQSKQSDPYPDDDALNAAAQTGCGESAGAGSDWIAYTPSRDDWTAGDRSGSCWSFAGTVPQA